MALKSQFTSAAPLTRTLFVGDLPADCSARDLCKLFEPFGAIASFRMKRGYSGRDISFSRKRLEGLKVFYFAFVKFEQRQSAELAFKSMQRFHFGGRTLRYMK